MNDRLRPLLAELKVIAEVLREKYPMQRPQPTHELAHIMYYGGEQNVVAHIESLVEQFEAENDIPEVLQN